MARTLVISNRKGGSGKSATAVNLAVELAARGQRVLLVDLDTQGHCAVGLGVQVPRAAPTVHGFLAGHNTLRAAVRDTGWFGVRLIAADNLSDHSVSGDRALLLRAALLGEGFLDEFDTVLLDTPPSLDGLLLNALCAADWVLVPFVPHFLSGEGVRQLARVIFRVSSRGLNDRLRILGFVPIMVDMRVGQHRAVSAGLGQQFGAARLLGGIRNDIRVAEAFAAGQPLRALAPKSRAVADYEALARSLDGLWAAPGANEPVHHA